MMINDWGKSVARFSNQKKAMLPAMGRKEFNTPLFNHIGVPSPSMRSWHHFNTVYSRGMDQYVHSSSIVPCADLDCSFEYRYHISTILPSKDDSRRGHRYRDWQIHVSVWISKDYAFATERLSMDDLSHHPRGTFRWDVTCSQSSPITSLITRGDLGWKQSVDRR